MIPTAKRLSCIALLSFVCLFIFVVNKHISMKYVFSRIYNVSEQTSNRLQNSKFVEALTKHSSPDKFIILAMTDASYTDMAINLFLTSFRRYNITHFLFVGTGMKSCNILHNVSLPCFYYTDDNDSEVSNVFNSPQFIRKMNIRTNMMLDALRAGFTVLHMDVDVVFLKNPLPDLKVILKKNDMAVMWDYTVYNPGFLVTKSTNVTIQVYERVKNITDFSPRTDDQIAFNTAIREFTKTATTTGFAFISLDPKKYVGGITYYEHGDRLFASECTDCMVVHNSWIVSLEAKRYRFKEHLTWMYDADAYYTSTTRKYMSYSNPLTWGSSQETEKEELDALKTALTLGFLLNRTVILPRFHCNRKECPLNSLLSLICFDRIFAGRYRESSFLTNPLVPNVIKLQSESSKNHIIMTKNNVALDIHRFKASDYVIANFSDAVAVEDDKIKNHFDTFRDNVLKFASLYRVNVAFSNTTAQLHFDKQITQAFIRKRYIQI